GSCPPRSFSPGRLRRPGWPARPSPPRPAGTSPADTDKGPNPPCATLTGSAAGRAGPGRASGATKPAPPEPAGAARAGKTAVPAPAGRCRAEPFPTRGLRRRRPAAAARTVPPWENLPFTLLACPSRQYFHEIDLHRQMQAIDDIPGGRLLVV